MTDEQPERTKPSDIALAEAKAWRQGIQTVQRVKRTLLDERVLLLKLGWPAAHALCLELDEAAAHWASRENQMRRDYLLHCDENHIQL